MKLNGTHQLLVYADGLNILGGSVHTIKENAKTLVVASKEIGLEVNADKTKYMVKIRMQDEVTIKIDNSSFERAEELRYLGTTLTNQNSIQEEIKSRFMSENACSHSVQSLLSSGLLSKNLKFKIYRTIILPVVLYGCETWSLTLRKKRGLRVFENRVLRRIFGPKMGEVMGDWRELHKEELNDLYPSPNIVWVIKSRRVRWAGRVARVGARRGVYRVLVGKPEETIPLWRPRLRLEDNIKMDIQEVACGGMDCIELA